MIILIAGDTHTGKTLLAQRLLERYHYPYLSIDHLKMGLIRSGRCPVPADGSDAELTECLWPIVREMIKTCIEHSQNLIVEGCYIPFGWEADFADEYLARIRYVCLVFSQAYLERNFRDILLHECVIERRGSSEAVLERMSRTNRYNLEQCMARNYRYVLIESDYRIDIEEL